MNLSGPFIRRPVATMLLSLAIMLLGGVSFGLLPVAPLPQMDFPVIVVQANLSGASPEVMAATVATPLERKLGSIAGVTTLTSSSNQGSTRVIIGFEMGRDIDGAAREVQAAINATRNLLAEGIAPEHITLCGNTVIDAIGLIRQKWAQHPYQGEAVDLFPDQDVVLVTTHRRENFGQGLENICEALLQLGREYPQLGFVFPVHLNPQVQEVVYQRLADIPNLRLIPPVDFETSLYLQSRSVLILTDSGGIQEEAPSLGKPVLADHLDVVENPYIPGAQGSAPFDSEGVRPQARRRVGIGRRIRIAAAVKVVVALAPGHHVHA